MAKFLIGKKVLLVLDCLELGGAERQALLLANHMREAHFMDVSVLALSEGGGKVADLCKAVGIPSHGISCNLSGSTSEFLKTLTRVLKSFRQFKPDIILPYTSRPNFVCGLLWRLSGARIAVWNQRDEGIGLDQNYWSRAAVWLTPRFVSNSVAGKAFLMRAYGVPGNRISIIRNGISLAAPMDNRTEWRQALGIGEESLVVCMLANLHQFKDHATLLNAWRKVLDSFQGHLDLHLVLPGRFAGTEQNLKELVSRLELGKTVRLLGKVDDVSGLLHAADLYVHSSKTEGVPNAILEAMAVGLPVIATDIPGNREAVGNEGAHGLVPTGDASAMAEKIVQFVNDSNLREKVGRVLKERVDRNFQLSVMLCSTLNLLEGLLVGSVAD